MKTNVTRFKTQSKEQTAETSVILGNVEWTCKQSLEQQEVLLSFPDPNECGVSVTKPRARNVRGNKATSGVWPWQINIYWDGKYKI